jgi:Fur family ferric uptake transcriptional regulator
MKPAMTSLRRAILYLIDSSDRPRTVRQIHAGIKEKADLSSVYRALEYFESENLVHSISMDGSRFYYGSAKSGHGHFIQCRECREILEFDQCAVGSLQKRIQNQFGYEITGHVLYFQGLCPRCRDMNASTSHHSGGKI